MAGLNLQARFFYIPHQHIKKTPGQRPGIKGGTGLGMPVPMARNKGESGPTPGYSVFTKKHFKLSSKNFVKQIAASLNMIKDYTEDMSKLCGQKDGKAG